MALFFAFLIGFFAGLRSLTAPATIAWAVHLGLLKLDRPLSLIGTLPSVVFFTVLAIGELVVDKFPKAPNRTQPLGLVARLVTGGLTGACVSAGLGHGAIIGAVLGAAGGLVGCFLGFFLRTQLSKAVGAQAFYVALMEDLVAIGGCFWIVSHF